MLSELPDPCSLQVRLHTARYTCLAVRVFLLALFLSVPLPPSFPLPSCAALAFSALRARPSFRLVRVFGASTPSDNARGLRSTRAREFLSLRTFVLLSCLFLPPALFLFLLLVLPAPCPCCCFPRVALGVARLGFNAGCSGLGAPAPFERHLKDREQESVEKTKTKVCHFGTSGCSAEFLTADPAKTSR